MCENLNQILRLLLPAFLFFLSPLAAGAQGVQWRLDYQQARKEAQEKNRPLLVDVGTENCFWCKRLDATTFRDPSVTAVINEHFVPLRIDATQHPALAEALRVQSYPTLVLAASDGKILDVREGYVDAAGMHDQLQRVLAFVRNQGWMIREYQEASQAIVAADYPRALALLKSIVEDGKDRPTQTKARQMLKDLEQQANVWLARARQLEEKGQAAEAVQTLLELARVFPGTHAATEGVRWMAALSARPDVQAQMRVRRARELLAQAREDYRTQQYLCCLERCDALGNSYAELPESTEARQLANLIKSDPEWLQRTCDSLSDRLGGLYLALAESWLKKGMPQQAELCLERVIRTFPGTTQAQSAKARLTSIQKTPPRQVEFKKD